MSETDYVMQRLEAAGAVMTGMHVVYASGLHGSAYINKDALYPDTRTTSWLCSLLARPFRMEPPDAVVGPVLGGIILAQRTADVFCDPRHRCEALYAEKDGQGRYALKRGYGKRVTGKRVLVVEDILTTGASAHLTIEAVRVCGGEVIGVAALVNRGSITAKGLGDVPVLHTLLDLTLDAWSEDRCPLCEHNVPIDGSVGRGAEFLARKHGLVQ